MTRAEFEADVAREGYEVRDGQIEPNVHRQPHAHDFDARLLVLDGTITLAIGDEWITYRAGDACSIPAGTIHAEHTDGDGARYVLGRRTPSRAPTAR
jgi:quercetin dioxygenase-like cupin family protein